MLNRPFDPETRIVSRAEQPPMLERGCDMCVVGSGASGISAAIEAARAGPQGDPGGRAADARRPGGQFDHRHVLRAVHTPGPNGTQLTHGIADEILHDLGASGRLSRSIAGGVMKVALYNEVALGRWVEKAVLKAGVTPLTGAIIRKVNREGGADLARHRDPPWRCARLRRPDSSTRPAMPPITWEAGFDCRDAQARPDLWLADDRDRGFRRCEEAQLGRDGGAHPRPRPAVRHDAPRWLCRRAIPGATSRSST